MNHIAVTRIGVVHDNIRDRTVGQIGAGVAFVETQVLVYGTTDGGVSTVFEVAAKVVDVVNLTVNVPERGPVGQMDSGLLQFKEFSTGDILIDTTVVRSKDIDLAVNNSVLGVAHHVVDSNSAFGDTEDRSRSIVLNDDGRRIIKNNRVGRVSLNGDNTRVGGDGATADSATMAMVASSHEGVVGGDVPVNLEMVGRNVVNNALDGTVDFMDDAIEPGHGKLDIILGKEASVRGASDESLESSSLEGVAELEFESASLANLLVHETDTDKELEAELIHQQPNGTLRELLNDDSPHVVRVIIVYDRRVGKSVNGENTNTMGDTAIVFEPKASAGAVNQVGSSSFSISELGHG